MAKLYELAQEILRLENAAYCVQDDEEFERLIVTLLEGAKLDMGAKLENIAKLLLQMGDDAVSLEAEEMRLNRRRKALERRAESLKHYAGNCLGTGNNVKTALFTFSWRKSTSVEITGDVPTQYIREKIVHEPDKKQIGDDLKAGADLSAFARLVEKQNLQIK